MAPKITRAEALLLGWRESGLHGPLGLWGAAKKSAGSRKVTPGSCIDKQFGSFWQLRP